MNDSRKLFALGATALALAGCAPLPGASPTAFQVRPLQVVRNGADPEALYRTGRYFQGQNRLEQAMQAYRQVLDADPRHVDAHNAIGVIHSLQGRAPLAEQEFRSAIALDPDAVRVHNNLGYHLLRHGRAADALLSFERAQALDPRNPTITLNVAATRAQLGLPGTVAEPVPVKHAQAIAAQPVPLEPVPAAPPVADRSLQLLHVYGAVWELRDARAPDAKPATEAAAVAAPVLTPLQAAPATRQPVAKKPLADLARLEIANGNGTSGLALRVAGYLGSSGAQRARLTNDKPFGAASSAVQYVAGSEQMAREVNASLPVALPLRRVAALDRNMRVRVLLGKGFAAPVMAALPARTTATQVAAADVPAGQ